MKQLIQFLGNGKTLLVDSPMPAVQPGHVLIEAKCSLVSLGTERMLVDFGRSNLLQKAISQPSRVSEVLQKAKTDGIFSTVSAVARKLEEQIPLGYSHVGVVQAVGEDVQSLKPGDRVVSNGPHSEFVSVPENLCAVIPDSVDNESASFTVLGAIALQGIRLIDPDYDENVVVFGLGLIGLLAVQILRSNGCNVIGLDTDQAKCDVAEKLGIKSIRVGSTSDPVVAVRSEMSELGADAVLITASTESNEVIRQSAQMCRKRGRVVLVGVVGLNLQRSDFYEKEITFQVSCSYGPGRYDTEYEEKGTDYPIGFVRWTERRNFESVLRALEKGHINTDLLVTQRLPFRECLSVYDELSDRSKIATVLSYSAEEKSTRIEIGPTKTKPLKPGAQCLGLIGAGNFANNTLVPILLGGKSQVKGVCSAGGLSAAHLARKVGASYATSEIDEILEDDEITLVLIATRHNLHANLVQRGLDAGKHVFVEKPLCLTKKELVDIEECVKTSPGTLSVGFNRRFAPLAIRAKSLVKAPMSIVITVNAGFVPADSWVHDIHVGGGRLVGEACHFMDLAVFLTGQKIQEVVSNVQGDLDGSSDSASILLRLSEGAQVSINYLANGHKSYPKERIEIFSSGSVLVIDNWRSLKGWGFDRRVKLRSSQDKGHRDQFSRLFSSLETSGQPLVSAEEVLNVSEAAIAAVESIKSHCWIPVNTH